MRIVVDPIELWTTMGHLYKGGMWLKKKAYITNFNANKAPDNIDWREKSKSNSWIVTQQEAPSASEINQFFFLPALGSYRSGKLETVGGAGFYWSSTARKWYVNGACLLQFDRSSIAVSIYDRESAYRVQAFE